MRVIFAVLILLPLLSACNTMSSRHEEDVSGIKSTQFQVAGLRIDPATPQIQADKMFPFVQQEMQRQLTGEIHKMPKSGQQVGVVVQITKLALYVDPTTFLLVGDNYSLTGKVIIMDMKTKQILKQKEIKGVGTGRAGIVGIIGNVSYSEEEKTQSAISGFTDSALYFIYPERSAWPL